MKKRFIEYLITNSEETPSEWIWKCYHDKKPIFKNIDLSKIKLCGNIYSVLLQLDKFFEEKGYSNFLGKYIHDCKNSDLKYENEEDLFRKAVENIMNNDAMWLCQVEN